MIGEQWGTWVSHGLQGAAYAFLLTLWLGPVCGFVGNATIWTHREAGDLLDHWKAGDLEDYRMDGWLDWVSALVGGGIGLILAGVI